MFTNLSSLKITAFNLIMFTNLRSLIIMEHDFNFYMFTYLRSKTFFKLIDLAEARKEFENFII